jgi:hypothetical protein
MSLAADAAPRLTGAAPRPSEVSLLRLYALRVTYALMAFVLGSEVWPLLAHHRPWEIMHGVAVCMLCGVSAIAALGLRYPLKVLPLMFLEIVWKSLWLIFFGLPALQAGPVDANMADTIQACAMGIIFPIVIPWGYVWRHFIAAPGDRWW